MWATKVLLVAALAAVRHTAADWAPCGASSVTCCNPTASAVQYCPGSIKCEACGGPTACECPSGPAPAPAPTPAPPPPASAACSAWAGCAALSGDCCPASSGSNLACCGPSPGPGPSPPAPGPSPPAPAPSPGPCPGPTAENPLGICPHAKRSDNFFLIIGDWGVPRPQGAWPYASGGCQQKVAELMKTYVRNQEAQGKKVLFVGSVGDNFYSTGLKDDAHWNSQWADVYGVNNPSSPLYQVPWMSVMGNHDHGNDDPTCACGKGCKQFNSASRPGGTSKYWMPDYFWHYGPIPGVDLEVIGLDTNAQDVGGLGGNGCNGGARVTCEVCGGQANVQSFLTGKKADGEGYLDWRARTSTAKTALILQHYDGALGMQYKNRFLSAQSAAGKNGHTSVVSAFGHAHDQVCMGDRTHGCDVILTGGGGGWQGGGYFGFTAVHLTDDGGYQTVLETSAVRFPQNTCNYLSDNVQANATSNAEQQFV